MTSRTSENSPIASAPITSGWRTPSGGHSRRRRPCRPGRGRREPRRSSRSESSWTGRALAHESQRQHEHHDGERDVQKKHRAPADVFDQPAASHGADRGGDRAESRPGADRATAFGIIEGGADDREAPGTRKAAPMPCRARPAMSIPGDVAMPHATEATVKKTTPRRNTRLRPN